MCFHTKLHFVEDVLGVGLNLESKLNGKLAYITTTFDLVSYQAFTTEKVNTHATHTHTHTHTCIHSSLPQIRKASYKEPFTHWLPLYINPAHGARALPLVQESMAKICNDTYGSFEPWMILEVVRASGCVVICVLCVCACMICVCECIECVCVCVVCVYVYVVCLPDPGRSRS